ncbi:efflux RND transporter periplasmic adaptor subunit [Kerstersia sp.]|uniref:efflux RND transporter periplasmic adaptor subunit n=1 Tax=Kerstersia sp. TaxID=1930783 RepID=UPI003F8E2391
MLLLLLGWWLWPASDQGANYVTARMAPGDIQNEVLASGVLEAAEQVSVGAQVSGRIESLKVKLGDPVQNTQLVAQIDSLPQQNAVRKATAALELAQAQVAVQTARLQQAQRDYERQQQLARTGSGTREGLDHARSALDVAQAELAQVKAQLDQAKVDLDSARVDLGYTRITSPMDGVVVAIVAKEGQTVSAMQQAPTIIKVAALDSMTVKAQISEADVVRVKPGMAVRFSILGEPGKEYRTTLRAVEPAPEALIMKDDAQAVTAGTSSTSAAVYYNGLFDVENPEGALRIGMTAKVSIVFEEAADAWLLPSAAILRREGADAAVVRVLDAQGKPVEKQVRVGMDNKAHVQILDGLSETDEVIVGEAARSSGGSLKAPHGPPGGR